MAGALGLDSVAALENYVYEKKGQCVSVHMALQMQDFSGTTLFAETIAKLSGGTFVKLPCVEHIDNDLLMCKGAELNAEIGELFREFSEFTKDGEIDGRERERMEITAHAIHRKVEEFQAVMFRIYCRDDSAKAGK